jgi:hypothetical protein
VTDGDRKVRVSGSKRLAALRSTRFRLLYLAPALALIALMAWALASPMGSSPDDDFHLTSIWCANASKTYDCAPGKTAATRIVPEALVRSACYIREPGKSAACQYTDFTLNPKPTVETGRGNFLGGYPPLYYATMNLFVGPNILFSVVLMRFMNILLFVGLGSALFALLPRFRRPVFVWGWLVSTIPLGVFLVASNNPSSWAIIGVGTSWLALLGYFETTGKRKIGLGTVFVAGTLMAAGSRSDAAAYAVVGIAIVVFLTFVRNKRYLLEAILPAAMVVVCGLYFLSANQFLTVVYGFSGDATATAVSGTATSVAQQPDPLSLAAFNLLNVPSLWAGVFGSWSLGWFDTDLPAVVAMGSLACFVCVAFLGFGRLTKRKAVALAAVGIILIVLPVYVLTKGGDRVGVEVQPRYLLPLIVLFIGVLLLSTRGRPVRFTRGQVWLIVTTLAIVQFVSLQTDMRRYITGVGHEGWNLDAGVQWWWNIGLSPMFVLIVGSIAYAGMVAILAWEVSGRRVRSGVLGGAEDTGSSARVIAGPNPEDRQQ